MKKCSEIKELISQYIDDELNADERREFEEHMDSCEECRNELDELMQIVGLCKDVPEEELPADFKIELHQKLLEVQKQSEEASKPAFYRARYFKLFSSVAAVLLLVFLVRGLYNFDLFPKGKTGLSAQKNDFESKAVAEGQMQIADAPANDATGSGEKDILGYQDSVGTKNQTDSTEIGRSTTDGRESQGNLSAAAAGESLSRNTTSITVSVDDPDKQVESIKTAAIKNSGVEQSAALSSGTGDKYSTEANGNIVMLLDIPNLLLNAFIDVLNDGYGKSNVQPEAVVSEDMSAVMGELLEQSDSLDAEIEKLENSQNADTKDLNKLKEQKTEIQNKIDALRLESDLTNVKVILKKK